MKIPGHAFGLFAVRNWAMRGRHAANGEAEGEGWATRAKLKYRIDQTRLFLRWLWAESSYPVHRYPQASHTIPRLQAHDSTTARAANRRTYCGRDPTSTNLRAN